MPGVRVIWKVLHIAVTLSPPYTAARLIEATNFYAWLWIEELSVKMKFAIYEWLKAPARSKLGTFIA